MRTRWLAFLSCTLISLPFTSAKAQTQPVAGAATTHAEPTLTASNEPGALQWRPQLLWTAQDAIPKVDAAGIDSQDETPVAPDKAECRWSFGVSNDWSCKIKPLTRHELPIHSVVHHLWPLYGKSGN